MVVKGNKPLSEIIAKKLFGIGTVPYNGQARMINSACKEAEKYHEQSISELKAENERLKAERQFMKNCYNCGTIEKKYPEGMSCDMFCVRMNCGKDDLDLWTIHPAFYKEGGGLNG